MMKIKTPRLINLLMQFQVKGFDVRQIGNVY